MSEAQKVIKYLAIAFAVFLIINIFSAMFYGLNSLSNIFDEDNNITNELKDVDINSSVSILSIDVSSANVTIKPGNILNVETDSDDIKVRQDNNKIYIEEKTNWFKFNNNSNIVITVPSSLVFDAVAVDTGAGKLDINNLTTDNLYLDLGAGKVNINNMNVNKTAEIDGGAGEINIKTSVINNLDMDMGVGKLYLNAQLLGNTEIDSGVGNVDIDLIGTINDYKITLDKGIGKSVIDDKSITNGTYGNGLNKISIDGGVGNINVSLNK